MTSLEGILKDFDSSETEPKKKKAVLGPARHEMHKKVDFQTRDRLVAEPIWLQRTPQIEVTGKDAPNRTAGGKRKEWQ